MSIFEAYRNVQLRASLFDCGFTSVGGTQYRRQRHRTRVRSIARCEREKGGAFASCVLLWLISGLPCVRRCAVPEHPQRLFAPGSVHSRDILHTEYRMYFMSCTSRVVCACACSGVRCGSPIQSANLQPGTTRTRHVIVLRSTSSAGIQGNRLVYMTLATCTTWHGPEGYQTLWVSKTCASAWHGWVGILQTV